MTSPVNKRQSTRFGLQMKIYTPVVEKYNANDAYMIKQYYTGNLQSFHTFLKRQIILVQVILLLLYAVASILLLLFRMQSL